MALGTSVSTKGSLEAACHVRVRVWLKAKQVRRLLLVVLASLQTRCPPSTEGTFVRWLQTVVQCALGAGALPSYCEQCWGTIRGAWAKQQDIGHHQRT